MVIGTGKKHFLFLLMMILSVASCVSRNNLTVPKVSHFPNQLNGVNEIWSLDNIYTIQDSYNPMLAAANGNLCFLGGTNKAETNQLVCINDQGGDLLWETDSNSHTAIHATPNDILVAYSGGLPRVVKYSHSGDLMWSRELSGSGIMYLSVVGDQVQVLVIPERFIILDLQSGETVEEIVGSKVYFHSNLETVVEQNGLQSVDPVSGNTKWASTINDEILLAPIFLDDVIILRTGRIIGKVICIDRKTGRSLWISRDNIIGNLSYSPADERVYTLSRDGELLSFDKNNGNGKILTQFTAGPFILNGEQDVGGYELAIDESNNILFILLGDSRQLFAFKVE